MLYVTEPETADHVKSMVVPLPVDAVNVGGVARVVTGCAADVDVPYGLFATILYWYSVFVSNPECVFDNVVGVVVVKVNH
jgi:hypothetical protein